MASVHGRQVKDADIQAFREEIKLKGYRVPLLKQSVFYALFLSFKSDL